MYSRSSNGLACFYFPSRNSLHQPGGQAVVDCVWSVMAHEQKPDFFFRRNGRVHLNRRGRQFSWLLAAELCASAVVMLDTPCYEVVWRVLATHSILQFPLHFPSRASPCAITFQLESTQNFTVTVWVKYKLGMLILALPWPWRTIMRQSGILLFKQISSMGVIHVRSWGFG